MPLSRASSRPRAAHSSIISIGLRGGRGRCLPRINAATAQPIITRRNGATMLACEMARVAWPLPRSSFGSSSSPTRNMNSTTPILAITPSSGAISIISRPANTRYCSSSTRRVFGPLAA